MYYLMLGPVCEHVAFVLHIRVLHQQVPDAPTAH